MSDPNTVEIYSEGLCYLSACAPVDMPRDEVERHVRSMRTAGTVMGWQITDQAFVTGEENGHIAECSRGKTRHWLFAC